MAEQATSGFARLLRQLRAGAQLTQQELAKAAGVSPRSVRDLERPGEKGSSGPCPARIRGGEAFMGARVPAGSAA